MRRRFCLCWILALGAALPAYPRQAEQRGLRLIVVALAGEAEGLRARILAGEEFAILAGEHSADVSRAAEGYLGMVAAGELRREYQRALDGLGPGEVSPVVSVPEGYALLQWLRDEEEAWMARRSRGLEAIAAGRYADAGEPFAAALEVAEGFSAGPSLLATSLNDQAELYRRQGRYALAVASYRRSLMLWEAILGREHPSMAELHGKQVLRDWAVPISHPGSP